MDPSFTLRVLNQDFPNESTASNSTDDKMHCVTAAEWRTLQDAIRNTTGYKISLTLFPELRMPTSSYPTISEKSRRQIEIQINRNISQSRIIIERNSGLLGRYFGKKLTTHPEVSAQVVNDRKAVTNVQPEGIITVDVRVLQSDFVAAVALAYADEVMREVMPDIDSDLTILTQMLEGLQFYLGEYSNCRTPEVLSSRPPLGLVPDNLLNTIGVRYEATVHFQLWHEMGHLYLGHFEQHSEKCEESQRQEIEADLFATMLPVDHYKAVPVSEDLPVPFSMSSPTRSDTFGFNTFFEKAYDLAGFARHVDYGCQYPTVEQRLSRARSAAKVAEELH